MTVDVSQLATIPDHAYGLAELAIVGGWNSVGNEAELLNKERVSAEQHSKCAV
jgi:hypothetical protein